VTAPTDPDEFPAVSRCDRREELPDPFETLDGESVETREDWEDRRRELKRLVRHYVYGYAPDAPEIDATVEETDNVLDGSATLREVTIGFADLPEDAPTITLAVFLPADRDGAVPTVLALNAFGNHATVPDEAVTTTPTVGEDATAPDTQEHDTAPDAQEHGADERGVMEDYWCVEYVLERGYGFATCHSADIDPDDDAAEGIRPYFDGDLSGPPGTEWGTLAAWAWGLQRCVDYLRSDGAARSDDAVLDDGIAVIGHSRCGKAALLAGATDERIGLVVPHQSGTGGLALARENGQESVGDITEMFPHWFADTFSAAAGQVGRLPVDQHLLAALVAPRPLIDTEGARDYWANPGRALDALEAADPVYEFLGVEGLTGDEPLYGDDEISEETVGRLLQYRRETEHTLNRGYWSAILDFADVHFER